MPLRKVCGSLQNYTFESKDRLNCRLKRIDNRHLGRQVKVWPDPIIFKKVLLPWIARNLEMPPLPEPEK